MLEIHLCYQNITVCSSKSGNQNKTGVQTEWIQNMRFNTLGHAVHFSIWEHITFSTPSGKQWTCLFIVSPLKTNKWKVDSGVTCVDKN